MRLAASRSGRNRRGAAAFGSALAALVFGVALSACGLVFDAPKVSLLVRANEIVFAGADDVNKLVGGETVLTILNDDGRPRQVVLVRLEPGQTRIPPELVEAESTREDVRLLGMTHVMDPKEATFEQGGFGYKIDRASFHVHLRAGGTYVLFDRLGGLEDGAVLVINPGEQRQVRS